MFRPLPSVSCEMVVLDVLSLMVTFVNVGSSTVLMV